MKILYYGGQKSGKSKYAEKHTLKLSLSPYYIATYDDSYSDKEMKLRIKKHQKQRKDRFITIEETTDLVKVIDDDKTYLVDCISMWILNNIDTPKKLFKQLKKLKKSKANIVFVLNNTNEGVIPLDSLSRKFVDLSGIVGQKLAKMCDEVYEVKLGLKTQLKG